MSGENRRHRWPRASQDHQDVKRIFATAVTAGATVYVRERDLPRLLPLWPNELDDQSDKGRLHLLAKLRRALQTERRRARTAHWSYDLNRHLGLLSAYKGELAALERGKAAGKPNTARGSCPSGSSGIRG
jgi:Family of unknown function (DUF6477)